MSEPTPKEGYRVVETAIYALLDPRDKRVRYVGKAIRPKARLLRHASNPSSKGMKRWIAELHKLGLSPTLEVIEWADASQWQSVERFWIAFHRAGGGLLNILEGGEGGDPSKYTEASLAKIREANAGKPKSPEHREKLRAALLGKKVGPRSDETRAKMRKPKTAKHRENIRAGLTGRKAGPPTAEHRAKISAATKGRPKTAEMRAKLSVSKTGKKRGPFTPEWLANMSAARKGRKHSAEWIAASAAGRARAKAEREMKAKCNQQ